MSTIQLARLEVYAYRMPIATPIKVAFGTFRDRPLVIVRAIERDGSEGYGEIWCNWPAVGAEHRARLAADLGERLAGRTFQDPAQAHAQLTRELEILALQTLEIGPIAQVLAGIDIALWDLAARRSGLPLNRYLGGAALATVPVYCSGINPDQPERFAAEHQALGHRAFKLKVGFELQRDIANLRAMRAALGPEAVITCDANQNWSLDEARQFAAAVAELKLQWIEEPLRVDAPLAHWQALARASRTPIAGGENMQGSQFDEAIAGDVYAVLQPDITKWGGVTMNLAVGRAAVAAGKRYCPHFFAGGLALLASLHTLAAAGGSGLLEFDPHPNAGRELTIGDLLPVREGRVPVPQGPGLGAEPDWARLKPFRTWPA